MMDFLISMQVNDAIGGKSVHMVLKGHSQLCDCVDLDASFSHFEKSLPQPEIKVHAEIRFIFRSICLIFNRLLKNLFLSVLLLIL